MTKPSSVGLVLLLACLMQSPAAGQPIHPSIVINNDTGANPPAASGAPANFGPVIPPNLCATSGASTTIQSVGHGLGLVPTNGSAVVWIETASGRRWSQITGVPNADTFTVQDSFNIAVAVACVVGGPIAGMLGNQTRLCNDLKAGWTVTIENTGTDYTDSGACQLTTTFQSAAVAGRLVIRGDDPENPTRILYQTNGNYFTEVQDPQLKLENLHLLKDTAGGTAGSIGSSAIYLLKNSVVSKNQGSWATGWSGLEDTPSVVLLSRFVGPFTTNCGTADDPDLILANYADGCSGTTTALSHSGAAVVMHNILDQGGANQPIVGGSVNNGFGGFLLYNTLLNGGALGIQIGANPSVVSGNLIGEAATLSGACFNAGTGANNFLGNSGEPHILWLGNAANLCPTARYAGGIESTPMGAATDIDAGAQLDPLFADELNLDFFPTNPAVKSDLIFPGAAFPLLTPALPVSTMTAGAAQRPGGGAGAYAY